MANVAPNFAAAFTPSNSVWCSWVVDSMSTTTACSNITAWYSWNATTTATGQVWPNWNENWGTAATNSVFVQQLTWERWSEAHDVAVERRAEVRAQRAQQAAEARERAKRDEEERQAARQRARVLLLSFLSDEQAAEFREHEFFHVRTRSGRRYRLRMNGLPVTLNENGEQVESLCIHAYSVMPNDYLPREDELLQLKLHLDADEAAFRKAANVTRLRPAA